MADSHPSRLDSWKAIAEYVGKDVRTAIRWEKDKGLPVHRLPGNHRSSVFAFPHEIDEWMGNGWHNGEHPVPPPAPAPVHAPPAVADRRSRFRLRPLQLALTVALLGLVAAASYLVYTWPGYPERITFATRSVQAWDKKGRLAWEYEFARPLDSASNAYLGDRDGDGRNDFVAVVPIYQGKVTTESQELYCFEARGRVLWRYSPDLRFNSPERSFEPPWEYSAVVLTPQFKPRYIWIAYHQVLWWPGCLVRLDMEGRASVRFENAGWITSLSSYENALGTWVLAGGINNEHDRAMVAVLKEDAPPSASPHLDGSQYVLDPAPEEKPYRYLLLPRSELNLATNYPVNYVSVFRARPGEIEVRTHEADGAGDRVFGIYLFSRSFDLKEISRTGTYWDRHRDLEKQGLIKHPGEDCPERTKATIRGWDAANGWIAIAPESRQVD